MSCIGRDLDSEATEETTLYLSLQKRRHLVSRLDDAETGRILLEAKGILHKYGVITEGVYRESYTHHQGWKSGPDDSLF
jgi:hypothetical protein